MKTQGELRALARRAFLTALLLTDSSARAEAAVTAAIGGWDPDDGCCALLEGVVYAAMRVPIAVQMHLEEMCHESA